jgi:plastocyanin
MKITFISVAVSLSLMLVSCGGGGPSTRINVTMTDFQFQPSLFTVPAGQEISFNSTNNGAVIHNLVVMKLATNAGAMFVAEDVPNVFWEVEVPAGGSADTTFTAPTEPGEYQVICRTEGHIASGMVAKLIVVSGE